MDEYEDKYENGKRRKELWGIDWPGHPDGEIRGPIEISLNEQPEAWQCLNVEEDPEAYYSYDDLAFMKRTDGLYCMVRTSGCSCPSPTETWGVVWSGTYHEIYNHLKADVESSDYNYGPFRGMFKWMTDNHPNLIDGKIVIPF